MKDIPNTKYVTINQNGYFTGGHRAKRYRSTKIWSTPEYVSYVFKNHLQKRGIKEIHALTSKKSGIRLEPGFPSKQHGRNLWCRVKMNDGTLGNWVFCAPACSPVVAAHYIVKYCIDNVWEGNLAAVILPDQTEKQCQKLMVSGLDLSNVR